MSWKDIWFDEMERKLAENMDKGMSFDRAYEKASNEAGPSAYDKLVDAADAARTRAKEQS